MKNWQNEILQYCNEYNIPIEYLSNTLSEPKVIPMIRGKAFEFSVYEKLKNILPKESWLVEKIPMNAELGFHDVDVQITHIKTNKKLRIECKLAKKESFRMFSNGQIQISVKCMRSRTLGEKMVEQLAPKLNIDSKVLSIHNDQYLSTDFDIVVTSIGNAFYRTNEETGIFEWKPTTNEKFFLKKLAPKNIDDKDLKDFAFNKIYLAASSDLVVCESNNIKCTRKKCQNKNNCGFIPNYPLIKFDKDTFTPSNKWFEIEKAESLFKQLLNLN